jgi:two-component system, sensor histidine kinase and response regulator
MSPAGNAAGRTSVLVTDDDPTQRMLAGAALDQMEIVEAENGLAAVQALEQCAFDLAILDLDMPVMDGFGVIEWARARSATRHLPIIVVTGRDDVVAIERAYALGATSFLTKPINWNVFRHQVAYVLRVAEDQRSLRAAKEQTELQVLLRARGLAALGKEIEAAVGRMATIPPSPAALRATGERLNAVLDRVKRASDILVGDARISREIVRCSDLASEAMKLARDFYPESAAEIALSGAKDLSIACDRQLATEALTEILTNALRFAPSEGVRLRVVAAPPDRVRFEVEDRGPGIPEHVLEAATAGGSGDGRDDAGLGLLMAKAIVELNGGHFGVMSEPGVGTEVFLSFPSPAPGAVGESSANARPRLYASALSDT